MAKVRFFVFLAVLIGQLSGCSGFFSRNDTFEKVHTVAVVSVYVNRDLGSSYWKSVEDKTNTMKLAKQGLLNASHQVLQKQMVTHLQWQLAPDIRQTDLTKIGESADEHYEGLHGVTLISPAIVRQMVQGQTLSPTIKAFIKEIGTQINVDAIAVMIIDSKENQGKFWSFLSDDNELPEIVVKLAVVNRDGDFVMNADAIPAPYVGEPVLKKLLLRESGPVAHEKIITAFQRAINKALDMHFYQAARNFQRMGYTIKAPIDSLVIPEAPVLTPAMQQKSRAIAAPSLNNGSSLIQPRQESLETKSSVTTPLVVPEEKQPVVLPSPAPNSVLKPDPANTPSQIKRRSLWSLPDNVPE